MRFNGNLRVNDAIRKELSRPFGRMMSSDQISMSVNKRKSIYAIGDVTVSGLLKLGYTPKVAIFDHRARRRIVNFKIIKDTYRNPVKVRNRRGTISVALWKAVGKASVSKSDRGIRVYGEEDLASLACIYFARKGSLVMYGLYNKGVAVITVNSAIKKYVARILDKMRQ